MPSLFADTHNVVAILEKSDASKVGKGFSGVETPFFENMLEVRKVDAEEEVQVPAQDDVVQENVTEEIADDVAQSTSPLPPSPQVLDKCSALVLRVEGLKTANTTQQLEILKLKARAKKLERLNKVKSSKLRRLKKVGTSQRIESSEELENVFNQERVNVDIDEGIELVVDQEKDAEIKGRQADTQAEIYNINLGHSSKVLSMQEDDAEVQEAVEIVTTVKLVTKVITAATTQVVPAAKPTVVAVSTHISVAKPAVKPKVLKIVPAAPAGKGILAEDPKPMKKKDQIEMDAEYARKLQEEEESHVQAKDVQAKDVQAKGIQYIKRYHGYKKKAQSESEACKNMIAYLKNTEGFKMAFFKGKIYDQIWPIFQARFDANMRFLLKSRKEMEKEEEEIIKNINETLAQKAAKRRRLREQAKEDENLEKQLKVVVDEDDDVFIEATTIGTKVPVVNYEIVMINNKPRYKIIRADDTHQLYTSFITLLKNFDREDLEDLWKIVKAKFSTSKPTNFFDDYLLVTLKTMFEKTDAQDVIWRSQQTEHGQALVKSWKLLTSCGVHIITFTTIMFALLVEKKYPLSRFTLEQLVNVTRLQVEEESEISKENTECVSAAGEELTAAKHKLELKLFKDAAAAAHMKREIYKQGSKEEEQAPKALMAIDGFKKEKEDLESKLTGFESASKDLDNLLGSQRSNKNKEDDTITDYNRPSPSIESNSSNLQSSNSSVSEHGESSESIMSNPMIKFVKAADCPKVIKNTKTKTARKSPVKYGEMYKNTTKSLKVRGNQRN
nr:hypothetical protein [Tanacetum cinerariifolium]